ncbi:VTT domain-containing protein [Robbsia sp. KACC 23696]|uniref:VTT domain-containing protein n=1 Tax=Robbsia sp. KACC 23696 TaxID=3149231 RepID=UPI00325AE3C1
MPLATLTAHLSAQTYLAAIFFSVLVTQIGFPAPAAPTLILAGTLCSIGTLRYDQALLAAIIPTLLADWLWFMLGRWKGRLLLNRIVHLSLSISSAIHRTRHLFEGRGIALLAIFKFLPGIGLLASPFLGSTGTTRFRVFAAWDAVGVTLWAAFWVIGGAVFEQYILIALRFANENGWTIIDTTLIIGAMFLVYRVIAAWRFRRYLAHLRITPDELSQMMAEPLPPLIYDARPASVRRAEPFRIPGAIPLDLDDDFNTPIELPVMPAMAMAGAGFGTIDAETATAVTIGPDGAAAVIGTAPRGIAFGAAAGLDGGNRASGAASRAHSGGGAANDAVQRTVVIYCVCPNEVTARRIADQLRRRNLGNIRALKGGLDAWTASGRPVEPIERSA